MPTTTIFGIFCPLRLFSWHFRDWTKKVHCIKPVRKKMPHFWFCWNSESMVLLSTLSNSRRKSKLSWREWARSNIKYFVRSHFSYGFLYCFCARFADLLLPLPYTVVLRLPSDHFEPSGKKTKWRLAVNFSLFCFVSVLRNYFEAFPSYLSTVLQFWSGLVDCG